MPEKYEKFYHLYKKRPNIFRPGVLGINHKSAQTSQFSAQYCLTHYSQMVFFLFFMSYITVLCRMRHSTIKVFGPAFYKRLVGVLGGKAP